MPSGSDILVIWIELLVLAGQINDSGSIYFNHEVPYTADLLSAQFGYPPATIQLALTTFSKFGMIEIDNDIIMITNWHRYQNEEALARIRQMNAERQRRHRLKKKEQKLLVSGDSNVADNVPSNVTCHEKCSSISISNISSISSLSPKRETELRSKDTQNVTYTKTMDGMDRFTQSIEKPSTAAAYLMDMGIDLGDYFIAQQYRDFLEDGMEEEAIMYAAYIAKSVNKVSWAYVKTILDHWLTSGIRTKEQAEEEEKKRNEGKKVNSNSEHSGNHRKDSSGPRTVYTLKPRFAGHIYDADGNDVTPGT